jgi:hypothetical protein
MIRVFQECGQTWLLICSVTSFLQARSRMFGLSFLSGGLPSRRVLWTFLPNFGRWFPAAFFFAGRGDADRLGHLERLLAASTRDRTAGRRRGLGMLCQCELKQGKAEPESSSSFVTLLRTSRTRHTFRHPMGAPRPPAPPRGVRLPLPPSR